MTTVVTPTETSTVTPPAGAAAGAPTTETVVTPPVVVPTPQAGAQGTPSGESKEPKKFSMSTGDEEIPEDAELLSMNKKALSKRIERATRSQLKERFGTDDPEEIKTKLARLADFEAKEEERRLASLSELERERELRVKAEAERDTWEQRVRQDREEREMAQAGQRVNGVLEKHIKPRLLAKVIPDLAAHLKKTYSDEQLEKLDDGAIEKWVTETYLKENPEFGTNYEESIKAGAKTAPKKQPHTNGANTNDRPASPTGNPSAETKSFAPSADNAMTSREATEAAAKQGIRWK